MKRYLLDKIFYNFRHP